MTLVVTHSTVTGVAADTTALVDGPKWDANHTLTGAASPAQGGTGVANNSASTITISGSFGTTFTLTADTSVTLPTTGTLATLAGTEELTNKTLTSAVAKGTWTASGTWTIPAVTLSGIISGGGNQINNVIIGTSTPLAGSFTSLSYSTTLTGTSTNAAALAVGRQGATNPVLNVDASTASVVTGLNIKGAAAAGGLALSVTSSGTNEALNIDAKGSGNIAVGFNSTGNTNIYRPVFLGIPASLSGQLVFGSATSGNITINPPAGALGSAVWTLQTGTDTFVGKATPDTLTNKTYDTAGTGNSFSINGLAATANTGTGAVVRASSPALTTPTGIVKGDVGLGNVNNVVQVATIKQQKFTASGNYTPSTGMLYCIIECVGGGGGGGGVTNASAGSSYGAGGGGSGGYSRAVKTLAQVQADGTFASGHVTVTIGALGSGGSSGSNAGSAGGDTSVGSLCIGKGGSGGSFASSINAPIAGAGGVAGTGDLTPAGTPGQSGLYNSATGGFLMPAGAGASSVFGGGANAANPGSGSATTGTAAGSHGAGGSGGASWYVASNAAGGNGSAGVVFITEFCSQ